MNPQPRHPCLVPRLILGLTAAALPLHAQLTSRSFGSGDNAFTMDFVTIGQPGNLGDPGPVTWGSVATVFRMGKYEVSEDMITKANTLGNLGITTASHSANRPATRVSWNEAARFVNWLNVSQGYSPAYKFSQQPGDAGYSANATISLWTATDAGYDANNAYRNARAVYYLPSENQWYKAAYYNPLSSEYYNYPTGSDTAPKPTAGSVVSGEAVYGNASGPAEIYSAGGLSPYGTMGQGGNAAEWLESAWDRWNNSPAELRGVMGGYWGSPAVYLMSVARQNAAPTVEDNGYGFRVAAVPVPEPSAAIAVSVGLGAWVVLWRRRGFR